MADIFYDDGADLGVIQGRHVAVLGYGSQGHAHALSLRDSGVDVRVGLPEGSRSRESAASEGLRVHHPASEACEEADLIMVLAPDHRAARAVRGGHRAQPGGRRRAVLRARAEHPLPAHPPAAPGWTCAWSPPRAPATWSAASSPRGAACRCWSRSSGTPPGNAWPLTLAYAKAIGGTRAGALVTTFAEETETDLFGEQAVLCGGVSELIKAGFDTLVEAGYQPEVAYFECLHEMKLIVDLMYEGGISKMYWSVSDTAEFGGYTRGPRIIDERSRGGDAAHPRRGPRRHVHPRAGRGVRLRQAELPQAAGGLCTRSRSSRSGAKLRPLMSWLAAADADDA